MAQPALGLGIPLGRIFGIPIYLHPSWFIILLLITLSVRTQFVSQHPGWTPAQHWILGIVTSMLFFRSVVFHKLCHNLVAMRYRIPVNSITLHVFGGLAKIQREAEKAVGPCAGRSLRTQKRQALLLGLSFNLYRLRHR
ncbi:MAG: hypothetical protein LAO08_04655 [Acidobacteriia bacterium]|nr:hypothetical protein [Terriglobia bacterium]